MYFSIRLEDEGRLADLTRSLKNEKQERKMADNNITQLQEELADLKSTKFSLEKVILMNFEFTVKAVLSGYLKKTKQRREWKMVA